MLAGCADIEPELGSDVGEANGHSFDKHLILLDEQLEDVDALDVEEIQAFLEAPPKSKHPSVLATHTVNGVSAAQAIYNAARQQRLNPLVLLVRLQLEQSLVSSKSASIGKLNWAMGCGCPDNMDCYQSLKGFDQQVACAAERLRTYIDQLDNNGQTQSGWAVLRGKTTSDGYDVTPKSRATAALYTYTPWVSAQKSHHSLWNKYAKAFGYVAPAPGGCPSVTFPSGVSIQLRPDPVLSDSYDGHAPRCFINSDILMDPVGKTFYPATTKLSEHFHLNEFVQMASGSTLLIEPRLVQTLERTRKEHKASIEIALAYQTPSIDGAMIGLTRGSAVMVRSGASKQALLLAAERAGATSCWQLDDFVYIGIGKPALGCPSEQ
jgi:hypothetical protein